MVHSAGRRFLQASMLLSTLWSQAPLGTDIYLFPLSLTPGSLSLGSGENITNHPGYDNQPHFASGSNAILFSSIRDGQQSDIYRYNILSRETERLTRTPESEYSPTLMPGGKRISVVRVETDGSQRLWRFNLKGKRPKVLFPHIEAVGYHAWFDGREAALFIVDEPPTLQRARLGKTDVKLVSADIGRCLAPVAGKRAVSFVDKSAHQRWMIMALNGDTGLITPVVWTLPGSKDYAGTPDGRLLMGRENRLYMWPGSGDWREVAILDDPLVQNISRLAVSPDGKWLAVVGEDNL